MNEPVVMQIALPAAYAESLKDDLDAAARDAGVADGFRLEEADLATSESELQFEPFTIAAGIYVANLIVTSVAGDIISAGLRRLIEKMKADPSGAPERKIVVLMPDLDVLYLDADDGPGVEAALIQLEASKLL